MKEQIIACAIAVAVASIAQAQYAGPGAQAAPDTVRQVLQTGKDDQAVTLRGHIVESIGDQTYRFADGTGDIVLEIDRERWPEGPVDDKNTVELTGRYDKELIGASKVKVRSLSVVR
ncbi:MAG: YgiW/YdeI family stress tolerance OB fold protein [Bordetella sp.]|uniref:YgiW/YdeI family stress tolerance OB fold protein n=1 Tax=Bordetella sp. TaxID=28081 RepID=UPI003F7C4999